MRDFCQTALPVRLSLGERSKVSDLVDWLGDFMLAIDPGAEPEWCLKDFSLRDEPLVPLLEGKNADALVYYAACFLTPGGSEGRLIRAGFFDPTHHFFPIGIWKVLFSGFEKPVLQAGCMNEALNSIVVSSDVPELASYYRALREFCGISGAISPEDVFQAARGHCLVLERGRSEPSLRIVAADTGTVIWSSEGHPYGSDPAFVEAATRDWSGLLERLGVPDVVVFEDAA